MATGGVREVGVRLKVGADGTDNLTKLAQALRALGVDTDELDRKAEELGRQLVQTGDAGADAAVDQDKLAEAAEEAAKAAEDLGRAAKTAAGGTGDLGSSSDTAKKQLGEMKLELAAAAATAYTIGRALGDAAKDAAGFESAMAEVATLVNDTSGLDAQAQAVRALAREYGGDAQGQAKALYQIISAGAEQGAEAIGILDQANKLAVGGVTDITTAADGLTSVLNAYGEQAGTAGQVSDALFVAMKAGKTTVGELSSSIGQVAPIAAQAGVGLDELLAGTAALTKGGVTTSQAITQIRGAISAVIAPSAEATKVAQSLGLQFDAQALKAQGLAGFLDSVRQATGGNTETMAKLFGSVEALGGVLALTGAQAGSFGQILQDMDSRAGATDEAFAKIADTSAFAGRQFQAALADVRISLGQAVTAFTPLVQVATDAINVFNDLPAPVKTTVAGVTALGVAIVPLTLAIGSITRAAGLATAALGLKARAAAAVVGPAAAAAAATGAMGTAAAAATPALVGAAAATTRLSRAMLALRAALPIGLILTVASLAAEFFRAKKEAEGADEAARKMLETPVDAALPAAARQAADAVQEVGDAAAASEGKLKAQADAARLAAQALGVDLARSAGRVSEEFGLQLDRLDDVVRGLEALEAQGVQTGTLVEDALRKMIGAAKNSQEFDALRGKIVQLGVEAKLSEDKVAELMTALEDGAKKAAGEVDELAEAYKRLGVKSVAELRKVADENKAAWELIRRDTTASIETQRAAFARYAESAIAANGGVVDSGLRAQAQALKVGIEFDTTGKAIVRAMGQGGQAVDSVTTKVRQLGREVNAVGEYVNQLAGSLGRMNGPGVRAQGSSAGPSVLGPGGGAPGGSSGGSFYTPPPSYRPDWYEWRMSPTGSGGEWVMTDAGAREQAEITRAQLAGRTGGLDPVGPFGGFAGSAAQRAGQPNPNVVRTPTPAPPPPTPVTINLAGRTATVTADPYNAQQLLELLREVQRQIGP
jgi:TP901 family phage tail tape measure protein